MVRFHAGETGPLQLPCRPFRNECFRGQRNGWSTVSQRPRTGFPFQIRQDWPDSLDRLPQDRVRVPGDLDAWVSRRNHRGDHLRNLHRRSNSKRPVDAAAELQKPRPHSACRTASLRLARSVRGGRVPCRTSRIANENRSGGCKRSELMWHECLPMKSALSISLVRSDCS